MVADLIQRPARFTAQFGEDLSILPVGGLGLIFALVYGRSLPM
jgi:hypothetical protein